ncbi:T9SS type A sorting domain-containing protein [Lewinella sp. W8]|uniref:T9SS type A sorting domain-containing protein n=1 Tax=Lewinella sp. W8 TaxID=2528208 RepID=UPI0015673E7E|nr:T9SS type A sorting domain-containing protein [Lewinella sp. W8]
MQRLSLLLLPVFLLFSLQVSAQNEVTLSIPDAIHPGGDAPICVPVIADSFPNIVIAQFSLSWDTAVVDFAEVRFGEDPLGLASNSNSTNMPEPDVFVVVWTNEDVNTGVTLESGTPILELCVTPKVASGTTDIIFDDFLEPEFAQGGTVVAFPNTVNDGSITFGADVATFVLPGDTNDDGQVDHRDVIGLGFGHGTTGPARPTPGVAFSARVAPLWTESLQSGINYATLDADGNGSLNDDDLTIISTYYDQFVNDNWQAAPVQDNMGIPGAPLIITDASLSSGQPASVRVELGDVAISGAAGYAMSFAVLFDPAQIDPGSISVDFSDSFLGDDLLTLARVTNNASGRLEIALARKDQINTTNAGGLVCTINFTPAVSEDDYTLTLSTESNSYQLADESSAPVSGQTTDLTVSGTTSVREPQWARDLTIFPNPLTGEVLSVRGNQRTFDHISVLEVSGRQLLDFLGNQRQLNLSALPAGTYLVQFQLGGQQVLRRLVVK